MQWSDNSRRPVLWILYIKKKVVKKRQRRLFKNTSAKWSTYCVLSLRKTNNTCREESLLQKQHSRHIHKFGRNFISLGASFSDIHKIFLPIKFSMSEPFLTMMYKDSFWHPNHLFFHRYEFQYELLITILSSCYKQVLHIYNLQWWKIFGEQKWNG